MGAQFSWFLPAFVEPAKVFKTFRSLSLLLMLLSCLRKGRI